jgi:integrase
MRRGEVLRLRWPDVEFDQDRIIARSRKQSRRTVEVARRIDLHPELKLELLAWREKRPFGQYVVCRDGSAEALDADLANRAFWQPMRGTPWCLSGKKNWFKVGFHTYRPSFASNLAVLGVDQRIIDEWMGHQTEAMRKRYRHLHPKDRRAAIESFSLARASQGGLEVSPLASAAVAGHHLRSADRPPGGDPPGNGP